MKPRISIAMMKDARILLGVDNAMDFRCGDVYFAQSCKNKYGEQVFRMACDHVRRQVQRKQ